MKALNVSKIQRTCVQDGPGLRTTVFFRGCGLRCLWCQNPECLTKAPETYRTVAELLEIVSRDREYYAATTGGVTLSGGEPFLQDKDSLLEFLKALKKEGLNVSSETCLNAPWETIEAAAEYIDLFLVDFKAAGNGVLHKKLTGSSDRPVVENFERLIKTGAKISLRMVAVPGHNDSEEDISAAAEFIKSHGFSEIEVLKYHNMHESKAKKLGLDIPVLNISAGESRASLENTIGYFKNNGVEAYNTELVSPCGTAVFTDRVTRIRDEIRSNPREICFEVSRLKTEYYKKYDGFKRPTPIHRAQRLKYVLENKKITVNPGELLVGNFTGKRVAGQLWEEQYGTLYAAFLYRAHEQSPVPFISTKEERKYFYKNIAPYWALKSTISRGTKKVSDMVLNLARIAETSTGFNNNTAAISHYIVNFDRVLELGTTGIRAETLKASRENPGGNQNFYRGVLICLDALEIWAERYADTLARLSLEEAEPERRAELEKMSEICRHVPKYPARNFHEALQSMLLLHIALCIEAYENAVSFGRLDQILYPYYKKDLEEGRISYDEAKELLCLFILKMDEVILINDGDSILNVGKLFETLSVDQALTFGGVDREGRDAVNDLTYMLIDACELQPLAVNMCARIHESNPDRYLDRLSEIYINGCPMPEMFSDSVYIDSLLKHYDTSLENARNYSIVGCVEPVASDDHYGNTDSANVNLTLPLLQALKGHEHDLWRFGLGLQIEKLHTRIIEFSAKNGKIPASEVERREELVEKRNKKRGMLEYDPPEDMDELLERFQARLNALTKSILEDQQTIEKGLRDYFTTPLASSLYKGCLKRGLDVYEGGTDYNTAGIQAVGVTDAADSLYAINEVVFKRGLYTLREVIEAIDANFKGEKNQRIREALMAVPKFGEDGDNEAAEWVTRVMEIYNKALDACPYALRKGKYTAGYYALNTNDRYGLKTQALPSGRLKGRPLANSVTPHYDMEQADLLSALNSMAKVNFTDYAVNGATATLTIDAALFPGESGVKNLGAIFKTFLTKGGMQLQPNIISRELLLDAYNNPEKHRYLMVRVAGYCSYFQELSDELKQIIINRACYA